MSDLDFHSQAEVDSSFERIDALLASGVFQATRARDVLFRAGFIELLIALRDLMYKTEKFSSRINFTDDVKVSEKIKDVSDLIKYVRDALCHPDSDNHYLEAGNIRASFNVAFGKAVLMKIGDFEQSSQYDDDVCFFFGSQRIYLQRHIVRAYREARARLPQLSGRGHR
jgi:hypothetical protein